MGELKCSMKHKYFLFEEGNLCWACRGHEYVHIMLWTRVCYASFHIHLFFNFYLLDTCILLKHILSDTLEKFSPQFLCRFLKVQIKEKQRKEKKDNDDKVTLKLVHSTSLVSAVLRTKPTQISQMLTGYTRTASSFLSPHLESLQAYLLSYIFLCHWVSLTIGVQGLFILFCFLIFFKLTQLVSS